jgi:hypothetical protein
VVKPGRFGPDQLGDLQLQPFAGVTDCDRVEPSGEGFGPQILQHRLAAQRLLPRRPSSRQGGMAAGPGQASSFRAVCLAATGRYLARRASLGGVAFI